MARPLGQRQRELPTSERKGEAFVLRPKPWTLGVTFAVPGFACREDCSTCERFAWTLEREALGPKTFRQQHPWSLPTSQLLQLSGGYGHCALTAERQSAGPRTGRGAQSGSGGSLLLGLAVVGGGPSRGASPAPRLSVFCDVVAFLVSMLCVPMCLCALLFPHPRCGVVRF